MYSFPPQAIKSFQASFHAIEASVTLLNYNHAETVTSYSNACKKSLGYGSVILFSV